MREKSLSARRSSWWCGAGSGETLFLFSLSCVVSVFHNYIIPSAIGSEELGKLRCRNHKSRPRGTFVFVGGGRS